MLLLGLMVGVAALMCVPQGAVVSAAIGLFVAGALLARWWAREAGR